MEMDLDILSSMTLSIDVQHDFAYNDTGPASSQGSSFSSLGSPYPLDSRRHSTTFDDESPFPSDTSSMPYTEPMTPSYLHYAAASLTPTTDIYDNSTSFSTESYDFDNTSMNPEAENEFSSLYMDTGPTYGDGKDTYVQGLGNDNPCCRLSNQMSSSMCISQPPFGNEAQYRVFQCLEPQFDTPPTILPSQTVNAPMTPPQPSRTLADPFNTPSEMVLPTFHDSDTDVEEPCSPSSTSSSIYIPSYHSRKLNTRSSRRPRRPTPLQTQPSPSRHYPSSNGTTYSTTTLQDTDNSVVAVYDLGAGKKIGYAKIESAKKKIVCGELTLEGRICAKGFQRPEHLKRHKQSGMHTKVQRFRCPWPDCKTNSDGKKNSDPKARGSVQRGFGSRHDNLEAHIVKTHLIDASKAGRNQRVSDEDAILMGWANLFPKRDKELQKLRRSEIDASCARGAASGGRKSVARNPRTRARI